MTADAVLIAGPTASGKSAVALALAEHMNGAIINTDSMQVYREARILTARPSDEDVARAPHLLYGHVSVARALFRRALSGRCDRRSRAKSRASQRVPIFTGGTGLYFGALTEGLAEIPPCRRTFAPWRARRLDELGADGFFAELDARDPDSARCAPPIRQRVLRAYEVFEATGRPLTHWQKDAGRAVLDGLNACTLCDLAAARRTAPTASMRASSRCWMPARWKRRGARRSRPRAARRQDSGPARTDGLSEQGRSISRLQKPPPRPRPGNMPSASSPGFATGWRTGIGSKLKI